MSSIVIQVFAATVMLATLTACSSAVAPSGPAGQPSSSDVNPVTGSRGGTNGSH